jgi:hypothetical protein
MPDNDRNLSALDDGFVAALDELPRECPARIRPESTAWYTGYDLGKARVEQARTALKKVGIDV